MPSQRSISHANLSRQARRSASTATNDIRAGHQSQDRQSARTDGSTFDPRPRRRSYRMKRIEAILVLGFCAPAPTLAQDRARLPIVGVLRINTAANNEPTAMM